MVLSNSSRPRPILLLLTAHPLQSPLSRFAWPSPSVPSRNISPTCLGPGDRDARLLVAGKKHVADDAADECLGLDVRQCHFLEGGGLCLDFLAGLGDLRKGGQVVCG